MRIVGDGEYRRERERKKRALFVLWILFGDLLSGGCYVWALWIQSDHLLWYNMEDMHSTAKSGGLTPPLPPIVIFTQRTAQIYKYVNVKADVCEPLFGAHSWRDSPPKVLDLANGTRRNVWHWWWGDHENMSVHCDSQVVCGEALGRVCASVRQWRHDMKVNNIPLGTWEFTPDRLCWMPVLVNR